MISYKDAFEIIPTAKNITLYFLNRLFKDIKWIIS